MALEPRPSSLPEMLSGLEYDHNAYAPEAYDSTFAPEVDHDVDAPERLKRKSGEDLPELTINDSHDLSKNRWKRPIWMLVGAVVILTLALGVGLGVGLPRSKSKTPATPTAVSPATSVPSRTTAAPSQVTNATTSSIGPQATALLSSVTLDTSLAAIATPDGNRRVFFQDGRNHVRQALFQNSTGAWSSDPTFIIATNARNHTPIAVYMDETEDLHLFYITANNTVSTASYGYGLGRWQLDIANTNPFPVHPSSRSLSVFVTPQLPDGLSSEGPNTILFLEAPTGRVTALNGSNSLGSTSWGWTDVSNQLYSSIDSNIAAPFASTNTGPVTTWANQYIFSNPTNRSDPLPFGTFGIRNSPFGPGFQPDLNAQLEAANASEFVFATVYPVTTDSSSSQDAYVFWVNGSVLASVTTGPTAGLQAEFPYVRLATSTPANSSVLYLYHQMNETVLTEEIYDSVAGNWRSSSSILISTA